MNSALIMPADREPSTRRLAGEYWGYMKDFHRVDFFNEPEDQVIGKSRAINLSQSAQPPLLDKSGFVLQSP